MNHTDQDSRATRGVLTAAAVGGLLAAAITGVVSQASADAAEASTAYGAAATGTDPADPQPVVTSDGRIKTASGSAHGKAGTFSATGITVKAGAGMAESQVGNLTVAGESFGSITATCKQGVTKVQHSGKKPSKPNMKVSYGTGGGPKVTGITVTITGAGDDTAQTVTAANVSCGKGDPPADDEPGNGDDTDPGNGTPAEDSSPHDGGDAGRETADDHGNADLGDEPAPKPTPRTGHHPVTG